MKPVLLDSCIVIDFLRNHRRAIDFVQSIQPNLCVSAITLTEISSGLRNTKEERAIDAFFDCAEILSLEVEGYYLAGLYLQKYRKGHGTGMADALIAATVTQYNTQFATLNLKHFPMFSGLERPY